MDWGELSLHIMKGNKKHNFVLILTTESIYIQYLITEWVIMQDKHLKISITFTA